MSMLLPSIRKARSQRGLATLIDRKYMEAAEVGWFSGFLGDHIRASRLHVARRNKEPRAADMAEAFCQNGFQLGWTPFVRHTLATDNP